VERATTGAVAVVVSISDDGVEGGSDFGMEGELIGVLGSNRALEISAAKLDEVSVEGVIVEGLNGIERVIIASRVMT
jgi:hypothetical protein